MRTLDAPQLVDPPYCACKGLAPQMREHTRTHCSTLTTDELNAIFECLDAGDELGAQRRILDARD